MKRTIIVPIIAFALCLLFGCKSATQSQQQTETTALKSQLDSLKSAEASMLQQSAKEKAELEEKLRKEREQVERERREKEKTALEEEQSQVEEAISDMTTKLAEQDNLIDVLQQKRLSAEQFVFLRTYDNKKYELDKIDKEIIAAEKDKATLEGEMRKLSTRASKIEKKLESYE